MEYNNIIEENAVINNLAEENIAEEIEKLIQFGLYHNMLEKEDIIPIKNSLFELLKINEPYKEDIEDLIPTSPVEILEKILEYAIRKDIIEDTITNRDIFDTKIMGLMMPRESEVVKKFNYIVKNDGIEKATEYFYNFSIDTNYIRMDRIQKNIYYEANTQYGELEITINLSKPEKDPKDIAAARKMPQIGYPKCLLCIENVGFYGNLNHPARQNLRVIPLKLNGEPWYFQYSPYVYYNEHCIVFNEKHTPMKISQDTFVRLFDFIEQFPHYFIGSNADLPIVGGSILNHDHFQGGRHIFPMEKASIEKSFIHEEYKNVKAGIVNWPMSVLRLSGDKNELIKMADSILSKWRDYTDEEVDIYASSKKGNETIYHNTVTPIARKNKDNEYEIDLVFRNNRTTDEYRDGIFHPHKELHHIKKENIGLIEVMGLAVLPGRLNYELNEIKKILKGETIFNKTSYNEDSEIYKHIPWIEDMIKDKGTALCEEEADKYIKTQVGLIFSKVLENAGVFKRDNKGIQAFTRLLENLGFEEK